MDVGVIGAIGWVGEGSSGSAVLTGVTGWGEAVDDPSLPAGGVLLPPAPVEAHPATPFCITGDVPGGHEAADAPTPLRAMIPDMGTAIAIPNALAKNFACFISFGPPSNNCDLFSVYL